MSIPNSSIVLHKVSGLSPTYRDTYYFSTNSDRDNFFDGLSGNLTLGESQITRVSNNQVKVPFDIATVREYNYMSIRNKRRSGANDRRYYCFIINAEYISDLCTLITYKVDVMQTFFYIADYGDTFVSRIHSDTDGLYEHREPEDFSVVNYTVDETRFVSIPTYLVIGVVAGTSNISLDGSTYFDATGGWYLNYKTYAGAQYFIFDISNDFAEIAHLLGSLVGREEAITDFYLVPASSYSGSTGGAISSSQTSNPREITPSPSLNPTSTTPISGHIPTNKKLYNYPYTMLRVISPNGQRVDLYFEEFNQNNPKFNEYGNWLGNGECLLLPKEYGIRPQAGMSAGFGDFEHGLTISEFPHCSYAGDNYQRWENQKAQAQAIGMITNAIAGLTATAITSAIGTPIAGAIALAGTTATFIKDNGQMIADGIEASKKPNPIYNNTNTSSLAITQQMFGWQFQRVTLSKVEAEQLDDYFTMFGYALNKKLNIKNYLASSRRPKYCYVRTKGMSVMGSFPAEYKMEMNEILDSGITFWKSSTTIGDYSNNDPV